MLYRVSSGGSGSSKASPVSSPPSFPSSAADALHHTPKGGASLARRNSGTKLSALAEERETKKRKPKRGSNGGGGGGGGGGAPPPAEKTSSGGFDIITRSCLLGFSDEEDGDTDAGRLEVEEDSFPLGLTTSLGSNDQEDSERGGTLQFQGPDTVRFAVARSGSGRGGGGGGGGEKGVKRASSFTHHQRNSRLSQQLESLNTRASSLSTDGGDAFERKLFPAVISSPSCSATAEIVPFRVPFLFSESSPGDDCNPGFTRGAALEHEQSQPKLPSKEVALQEGRERARAKKIVFGPLRLSEVLDALVVAKELHAMGKARQGPILLLSTSADLVRSGGEGKKGGSKGLHLSSFSPHRATPGLPVGSRGALSRSCSMPRPSTCWTLSPLAMESSLRLTRRSHQSP